MGKVNNVVNSRPAVSSEPGELKVSLQEIIEAKQQFIARIMSFSREEFAEMFGKKGPWALERMKDGSVIVLDEFAKAGPNGIVFSKSARVCADSVKAYHDSLMVPVAVE